LLLLINLPVGHCKLVINAAAGRHDGPGNI